MQHWIDPRSRGIYDHPAAPPPVPKPHHANDHGARIAIIESHIHWSAWDRHRVEAESRARADDIVAHLAAAIGRISSIETKLAEKGRLAAVTHELIGSVDRLAKTSLGAFLIWAVIKGWLTPDQFKGLLGVIP